jgi:hypothetical protein
MPIGDYNDDDYNTKRLHSFIDFDSPIAFELKTQLDAMAASSTCPLGGVKFRRLQLNACVRPPCS